MKLLIFWVITVLSVRHHCALTPIRVIKNPTPATGQYARPLYEPEECYVVPQLPYAQCFILIGVPSSHQVAQGICWRRGGKVALINNETTWKLLTQEYLQKWPSRFSELSPIWLGYTISSNGTLKPTADLSTMTSYWTTDAKQYPDHCIYASVPSWKWSVAKCDAEHAFLCQFDIKICPASAITDPNAIIKSCQLSPYVPTTETVNVECTPGYYLNTSTAISCRKGTWDDVQCVPGCPPPGNRKNSRLDSAQDQYDIGETITYTCNEGYFSWNDFTANQFNITCQLDSTWSDENAGCYSKQEISISTINVTSLTTAFVELDCGLSASNPSWYHNGLKIDTQVVSSDINVNNNGNLIVNLTFGNTTEGFYVCTGKTNGRLEIGQKVYELTGGNESILAVNESFRHDKQANEGDSLLLSCSLQYKNHVTKWFKDGQEIFTNANRNIIPDTGLLLSNITLYDEGNYKCQSYFPKNNVYANTTYDLSVIPWTKTICGTKTFRCTQYNSCQLSLAVIRDNNRLFYCYGTLISSKWVITTASCVVSFNSKTMPQMPRNFASTTTHRMHARIGKAMEWIYGVKDVKIHPLYRRGHPGYDVGLLELSHAEQMDTPSGDILRDKVIPACISPDDIGNIIKCNDIADLNGTVTGVLSWLDRNMGMSSTADIELEKMSVVPKKTCRDSKPFDFTDDQFCAKFNGEKEKFVGDTGSPFFVHYKGRNHLLGIYNSGDRDIHVGEYDYFTSISYHYNWIKSIIS